MTAKTYITFHHVDIVIEGSDPKAAYAELQARLQGLTFDTNTYSQHVDGQPSGAELDVGHLLK